jgi:hypothetical protein
VFLFLGRLTLVLVLVADHVDVDAGAGKANDAVDDRAAHQLAQPAPARGAENDLRSVERARGLDERLTDIGADDLAVAAFERRDELALRLQAVERRAGEPILRTHMYRDQLAAEALGHASRAAHQALAAFRSGKRDEHALVRLPGLADPVPLAVLLQSLLDLVGDPEQGEFAQCAEVPGPEVVRERGVDAIRRIDVAAGQARAHGLGR